MSHSVAACIVLSVLWRRCSLWKWLKAWGSFGSWTYQMSVCWMWSIESPPAAGVNLMAASGRWAWCCGAGGTQHLSPQGHQIPTQQLWAVSSQLRGLQNPRAKISRRGLSQRGKELQAFVWAYVKLSYSESAVDKPLPVSTGRTNGSQ